MKNAIELFISKGSVYVRITERAEESISLITEIYNMLIQSEIEEALEDYYGN